ncbi:MAG: hypothetical protein HPY79_06680 [Bacteroidales bacterium]|nr:hypothetical protein [Bacteroidales bacterium]
MFFFRLTLYLSVFCFSAGAQNIEQEYNELIKAGNYLKALKIVEEGIASNPNINSLYFKHIEAILYLYSSNKDTSENILNKAYQSLFNIQKHNLSNHESEKLKTFSQQLSIPFYRKAAIYMNLEQFDNAKNWFHKTLQIKQLANEYDDNLFFYTGLAAYNANDNELMQQCFSILIQNNNANSIVYEILLNYYFNKEKKSQFKQLFDKALLQHIELNENIHLLYILILEKDMNCTDFYKYNKQLQWYSNPNIEIKKEVANMNYICNDTNAAIQQYQTILSEYPHDTFALTQIGIIYYNKGIKYLQEAKRIISISEQNIEPYRKLKDIHIESMKYAVYYLEKAIMQSTSSQNVIQCLYLANKYLQRKEAMNQLKQKYLFIKE